MDSLKIQITSCFLFTILLGAFPEIITDIDGDTINLKELTTQKTVAVITMKSPDCPVCQTQLLRITAISPKFIIQTKNKQPLNSPL